MTTGTNSMLPEHERDPCPPESLCWRLKATIRAKDKDYQQLRQAYADEVAINGEAIDLLNLVSQELQCGDRPTGHYCPSCDNSLYNISQKVEAFLKKLI